jgi:hypothetical protein
MGSRKSQPRVQFGLVAEVRVCPRSRICRGEPQCYRSSASRSQARRKCRLWSQTFPFPSVSAPQETQHAQTQKPEAALAARPVPAGILLKHQSEDVHLTRFTRKERAASDGVNTGETARLATARAAQTALPVALPCTIYRGYHTQDTQHHRGSAQAGSGVSTQQPPDCSVTPSRGALHVFLYIPQLATVSAFPFRGWRQRFHPVTVFPAGFPDAISLRLGECM